MGGLAALVVALHRPAGKLWDRWRPFPIHCSGKPNDPELIVIDGRQADVEGSIVDAQWHCHVVIRNAELTADSIVKSGSHATVEIVDSQLRARSTVLDLRNFDNRVDIRASELTAMGSDPAIRIDREEGVTIADTIVRSGGVALWVDWADGPVDLRGGEVSTSGQVHAAWVDRGTVMSFHDTVVKSPEVAVAFDRGKLAIVGGRIVGGSVGIRAGTFGAVSLHGTHVEGSLWALEGGDPKKREIQGSEIVGPVKEDR